MNATEALEKFHYDTQWRWLHFCIIEEKWLEPLQKAIRQVRAEAKQPKTRFMLSPELRRLMLIK